MANEQISLKKLMHFTPKQEEATRVADINKYTLFAGSAGPGKSFWLRWYMLRTLIKWGKEYNLRGIRGAMFCEDYPTLKDRQISKMEVEFPSWLGQIKETKTDGLAFYIDQQFGGHVLMLRNLDDPAKYLSSEFAMIAVEELTQNEEMKFHRLRSRLRWTGIPQPKFIAATNPGGRGHEWVKRIWIDRKFGETEKEAELFAFVPALPTDNPHLAASYILTLQSLPEKLRQAYLEGRWDIFEGMFFTCWDPKIHVCDPFEIPDNWPVVRGIDPSGRSGTTSSHLYSLSDDGTVYVTHEHYRSGMDVDEHARAIHKMSEGKDIKYTVIDGQAFSKLGLPESTAEVFERNGITDLIAADKKRIPGWDAMNKYLRPDPETGKPRLVIFTTCPHLIRTIPLAMHPPIDSDKDPQDVMEYWDGAEHLDALDECLVGETLITTKNGNVFIKDIKKGDMVLTREGYRKVLQSRMTKEEEIIYTIETSDGRSLSGSANHPVWVENKKSFLQLHELRYSDTLNVCYQKSSFLTELDITDIQSQKTWRTGNIFLGRIIAYIEQFGNSIMEKFRRGFTFITKMRTIWIILLKTWSANLGLNTFQSTQLNGIKKIRSNQINTWMTFGTLQNIGMKVKKDRNGTVNIVNKIGKLGNQLKKNVINVQSYFRILLEVMKEGFAQIIVKQHGVGSPALMMNQGIALPVENNLLLINTARYCPAQEPVVYVTDIKIEKEKQAVYNLSVEDVPEYYANGILVHNCRYVLQTLREQVAPKKMSAAEKRFMMFQKMDEGLMNNFSYRRQ